MQISPCKYKTDSQSGDGPLQRVQGKEGQKHRINFHEDTENLVFTNMNQLQVQCLREQQNLNERASSFPTVGLHYTHPKCICYSFNPTTTEVHMCYMHKVELCPLLKVMYIH